MSRPLLKRSGKHSSWCPGGRGSTKVDFVWSVQVFSRRVRTGHMSLDEVTPTGVPSACTSQSSGPSVVWGKRKRKEGFIYSLSTSSK